MRRKLLVYAWICVFLVTSMSCRLAEKQINQYIPVTGEKEPVLVTPSPTHQANLNQGKVQPEIQNSTTCPGAGEKAGSLEYGEQLYNQYCTACHGRQGQGYPGYFPALTDSSLATSDNIQPALMTMMNTDIHPMASLLFERGALSVINYIRYRFAGNRSMICPGDVKIEINP